MKTTIKKRQIAVTALLIFAFLTGNAQKTQLYFNHITFQDGLPFLKRCNVIAQDKHGFIWIGSDVGLHRFDGNDFKTFYCKEKASGTLSGNYVNCIEEDLSGNLLIGTSGGMDIFDPLKESITFPDAYDNEKEIANFHDEIRGFAKTKSGRIYAFSHFNIYSYDAENKRIILISKKYHVFTTSINRIITEGDSVLWIANHSNGILRLNLETGFILQITTKDGLSSNNVTNIIQVSDKQLVIGSGKGIDLLSIERINGIDIAIRNLKESSGKIINALIPEGDSICWIATDGNGLLKLNMISGAFHQYLHDEDKRFSILNNKINTLFQDRQQNLWAFSNSYGLSITNPNEQRFFKSYTSESSNGNCLSYNLVSSFLEDKYGRLWIGTDGGGLDCFHKNNDVFTHFKSETAFNSLCPSNSITCLYPESENEFIVGAYNEGIYIFDIDKQQFKPCFQDMANSITLAGKDISSIAKDMQGNLYILTYSDGLYRYNRKNATLTQIKGDIHDPFSLSNNGGNCVIADHNGDIWIATFYGLNRLDTQTGRIAKFLYDPQNNSGINSFIINTVVEDNENNIWVGTENGLNAYIRESNSFISYSVADGLPDNKINSILDDNLGNLWIGTGNGLSKFNKKQAKFENYFKPLGLSGNYFLLNSCYRGHDGEIYFGTTSGYTSFNPDYAKTALFEKPMSPLYITDLLIFDKPLPVNEKTGKRIILSQIISQTNRIILSHKENNFTFKFSVIDFIDPGKYEYSFIMKGFDNDWRSAPTESRIASYTNLDPGEYTFVVKAINEVLNLQVAPFSIKVKILPPWWKTWWAISIYVIIIIVLVFIYFNILESRMNLKKDLYLEKICHEKEVEATQMKIDFFTNITHEFRTPLTLILGPLENLVERCKNDLYLNHHLSLIRKSARRLLDLINEVLNLQKLEEGSIKLRISEYNIVQFVKDITDTFQLHAKIHHIEFSVASAEPVIMVWYDSKKLEKVFFNILSNAFKFTPDGGKISCRISLRKPTNEKESVEIQVKDSGIGIQADNITDIYQRYYTKGNSSVSNTGIGLSLSKDIVDLHKGKISGQNNRNGGACFTVTLPIGKEHFSIDDIVDIRRPEFISNEAKINLPVFERIEGLWYANQETNRNILLIVEDNEEVRDFIKEDFIGEFDILEASNGSEGLKLAMEKLPDIVISDILMPDSNGIELCKKLKRNELTSHIPVILLTALSGVDNQILGAESGADEYISKPFHPKLLKISVKRLIELRKVLQEKYSRRISPSTHMLEIELKEIDIPSIDEIFLRKAIDIIEENISNSDFEIENLCHELGMNYLQLYRKVKALTNLSIKNFILNIRLKAAANLLLKRKFTVSEIGFEVGFSSPAYFTKCFKKYFGLTPTEYLDSFKEEEVKI